MINILPVSRLFSGSLFLFTVLAVTASLEAETAKAPETVSQRLTSPDIATALNLTDEQKAAIAVIVAERDKAAAEADDAGKIKIQTEANAKLLAVLNADQKNKYQTLFEAPRLKFNFRLQKWPEVLNWIADEADLSLVMDQPPPGTFNYKDSKEYTPTEAIDLLNGWLLTKGYTLVRRERLLMCLNLKGGLPEGAIPQITPEDLATRGQFEFVSVLIPLEGRPVDAVKAEITPLLGTYGKAEALAATGQILVSGSAGKVRLIEKIVKQIPVPAKPGPKPPVEKPTVVVYPIKHADPTQPGEVLKQIISGTVVVDTTANQITINATPTEQTKAKLIIDQLEANLGPEKQPVLELYPVRSSNISELLATLQLVAPTGQFRFDAPSKKLVAWATKTDQDRIAESLLKLAARSQEGGLRQLEVYPLEKIDPSAVQTLVQILLPELTVTVDSKTGSLIVIGTLADHQAINSLIEQLKPQIEKQKPPEVRTYPVTAEVASMITTVLGSVVPEATITTDSQNDRLLVVAPLEKQEFIAKTIEQLQKNLTTTQKQLKIYDSHDVDTTSVTALLQTLAPQAQVTLNTVNEQFLVIATAKDHAIIENVLKQVASETVNEQPALKSYPLQAKVDITTLTTLLSGLVPKAAVTPDTVNRRLLITATVKDHAVITQVIEQVSKDTGGEVPELRFYPLDKTAGSSALTILQAMYPGAQISFEEQAKRLSVVADKSDHEAIAGTLKKLEESAPAKQPGVLKIYDVNTAQRLRFTSLSTVLMAELPGMQVLTDTEPGEMTIWAKPDQHEIIAEIIKQLQREVPPDQKAKLIVYPIRHVTATAVAETLTDLFPDAKITPDEKGSRILIHAKPKLHETIRSAIEQLDTDTPVEKEIKLMVYPVKGIDPAAALQLINSELPEAYVIQDRTGETLIVRAKKKEHQEIVELLDALKLASSATSKRTVVIYPMVSETYNVYLGTFWINAFPKANIMIDPITKTMMALATKEEHESIRSIIEEMSLVAKNENAATLKLYAIRSSSLSGLSNILLQAVPRAKTVFSGNNLLVWASEKDHLLVKEIADGINGSDNAEKTVEVFDLGLVPATTAQSLLAEVAPGVQFLVGSSGKTLIARVDADLKIQIQNTITQLADSPASPQEKSLKFYDLGNAGEVETRAVLAATVPTVSFTSTANGKRLLAIVSPEEHEKIETTLKQITEEKPFDAKRALKFYDIDAAGGAEAQTVLATAVPDVSFTTTTDGKRLLAMVSPEEDEKIEATLKQITEEKPFDAKRTLKFYDIDAAGGAEAQTVLATAVPEVSFTATADGKRLLAIVSTREHEKIEATLKQISEEKPFDSKRKLVIYSIRDLGPSTTTVLSRSVPGASINAGANGDQIAVVATEKEHEELNKVLAQLQANKEVPKSKNLAVYKITGTDPTAVYQVVQPLMDKDVQVTVDTTGRQLFVRAPADKQQKIRTVIEQILAGLNKEGELTTKTYFVGAPNADEAQEVLLALYPTATIVTDADRKVIVATATPQQHIMIEKIAKQIGESITDVDAPYPVVYSTKHVQVNDLQRILSNLYYGRLNRINVAANVKTGQIVVVAREKQHETIKELITQYDTEAVEKEIVELEVYRVAPLEGFVVQMALEPLVSDRVKISAPRRGTNLLVSAPAEEQKQIHKLIEKITTAHLKGKGIITKTYRLARGEADEAQEALQAMFPDATLVTDRGATVLIATATPEQHEVIENVVGQMTGILEGENGLTAKTYHLVSADGDTVLSVLSNLFVRTDEVRLSLDQVNQTLVAVARPSQHKTIQALLAELDPQQAGESRTVDLYEIDHASNGDAFVSMIQGVLRSEDKAAKVLHEPRSRYLVVTTTKAGHLKAQQAIDRMKNKKPRELEVFQLSFLESLTAMQAVDGLYNDGLTDIEDIPSIQTNEDAQQLIVRASPEQIEEIRSLLVKMGEVHLTQAGQGHSSKTMRIIPINGDVEGALRKVENLWPKMRKNPIRILKPQGTREELPGHFSVPPEKSESDDSQQKGKQTETVQPVEKKKDPALSPIVIMQGPGRLTIASDDTEALDQMEALLRAMFSRAGSSRNRDFGIYQLKNAGATEVSTTLKQIFNTRTGGVPFGSVILVPEERLNVLIVYAGRSDRERIEQLIQVLDIENIPDTKRAFQTKVIPLIYANAARVERLIQGIYRPQMTAGGSRRNVTIPKGVPPELATVLRQINAAASSPLLTVEVQAETNSLIVKAPQSLLEEIEELVTSLDDSARTTRSKGITLVPLKKTNSRRVMQILNGILD